MKATWLDDDEGLERPPQGAEEMMVIALPLPIVKALSDKAAARGMTMAALLGKAISRILTEGEEDAVS